MRDLGVVARLHGVEERDERGADARLVALVGLLPADLLEEVPARVEVKHDVEVLAVVERVEQACDAGLVGDLRVERDLAPDTLEVGPPAARLAHHFDCAVGGVGRVRGASVDRFVHDAMCA